MEDLFFLLASTTRENAQEHPSPAPLTRTQFLPQKHTLTEPNKSSLLGWDMITVMIFHFPHTHRHTHTRLRSGTARVLHKLFFRTSVHSRYSIASFASSQLMHSQQDRWFIINTLDTFKFLVCVCVCLTMHRCSPNIAFPPPICHLRLHIVFRPVSVWSDSSRVTGVIFHQGATFFFS